MAEFMNVGERGAKQCRERRDNFVHSYKSLFRFEKESVSFLADNFLGPETNETRGGALTQKRRMEIFLRYCADPGFQLGVGEDLGVERSTVCKTFASVVDKIHDKAQEWITFPRTELEVTQAKELWQERYRFPQCIGAIDCTHVRIQKPVQALHPDEYVNRKGWHSYNIQATCNGKGEITSVDASWPGSVHDSRIFRNSFLPMVLQGTSAVILGDSGYGIAPYLMVPYPNPVTHEARSFNSLLSRERVLIEQVFGEIKKRFPIVGNVVRVKTQKVPRLFIACCVLHNVSKFLKDDSIEENDQDPDGDDAGDDEEREDAADVNVRRAGQRKRDQLSRIVAGMHE